MVELEFIKRSVEDHLSTSLNVRPSLHDIYSTVVSMRRVFGSSHMDFCLALSHTVRRRMQTFRVRIVVHPCPGTMMPVRSAILRSK